MTDFEDYDDDEDTCPECGAGPYDEGCPSCKSCGGMYSPGTEECDFCRYSDECDRLYTQIMQEQPV